MKDLIQRFVNVARNMNRMIVEVRRDENSFCFPDGGKMFIAKCQVQKISSMRSARELKERFG